MTEHTQTILWLLVTNWLLELHLKFEKKQNYKFCLHDLQKSIYNIWKAAVYIHLVNIYHSVLY